MGRTPSTYSVLPNTFPEDEAGQHEWYEYLGLDDEEEYNHSLNQKKRMAAKERAQVDVYYLDDDSSDYFGYSYEEILAMYEDGTNIPQEVLNWAMNMAQNDVTTEDIPVQADDAEALYLSLKQSPDNNLKTITKIFSEKCVEKMQELDSYREELASLLQDITVIKDKIEILKEEAQRETEPLKDEWEDINYKIIHNIPLTEEEGERANYLRGKFGEIDENYKSQISSEIVNISLYLDKIDEVSEKIETANSYSRVSKTILDDLTDNETSTANQAMMTKNDIQTEEILSNEQISADFTTKLYNSVYELDDSIDDASIKSSSIQNIMSEMSEIGGFQLNDPNHTVTMSFSEDIDFSAPNDMEIEKNEEEPLEPEAEPNVEDNFEEDLPSDLEDLTVELPLNEETNTEFVYNPDAIRNYEKPKYNNTPKQKPYIKAPEGTFNQSGNDRRRR